MSVLRAFKMVEQERYRQQLRHRIHGMQSHRPCCIRRQRSDHGEREERQWQPAGRPFQGLHEQMRSIVGINTINQITMKIATPDVDHSIEAATSTA